MTATPVTTPLIRKAAVEAPRTIVIFGVTGCKSAVLNGFYELEDDLFMGRPCWLKQGESDIWLMSPTDGMWDICRKQAPENLMRSSPQNGATLPTLVGAWEVWDDSAWTSQSAKVAEADLRRKRLNFLDWWRLCAVCSVVFGHSTLMGLGGGINPDGRWGVPAGVMVDDRGWDMDDPTPMSLRAISISRFLAIPLLFWISGSAFAISFNGKLKGLGKLATYCLVGVACNSIIWFLGPQKPTCGPLDGCESGILLNFTIVPGTGYLFPLVFQMWYVMALLIFIVLHYPMMVVLHGRASFYRSLSFVMLQFVLTSTFYIIFIWLAGSDCSRPLLLTAVLIGSEALYLFVATAATPGVLFRILSCLGKEDYRFHVVRLQQYLLGLIGVLQYSATPIADSIDSISALYLLFIFIAFSKFFLLGFVMMKSRQYGLPLRFMSYLWPVVVVALLWCPPSTNWQLAGNLAYPFMPRLLDRVLNAIFGVMVIFCFDCIGQLIDCARMPNVLQSWSLALYLFHPTLITVFIVCGEHTVPMLCLMTFTFTFVVVGMAHVGLSRKKGKGAAKGS